MVCNSQFSVHYVGKAMLYIIQRINNMSKNMLKFSVDRQLITTTMKSARQNSYPHSQKHTLNS
jgi:hypothetical protein